jgi:hydrogenase nickel incorporation protein HypB
MCNTCGCNITPGNRTHAYKPVNGVTAVSVIQNLLAKNDDQATHNRQHFDQHQVLAINLMSSPGSGKTALLEATIDALKTEYRIGVIEGDMETENDAARIRAKGVPAHQITTAWISCSSKTSATWCVPPASTSASTAT